MSGFHDHTALTKARHAHRKALGRALRATGCVDVPPWEHPQPVQFYNLAAHLDRLIERHNAVRGP
jgi:hypothetical protein